jgi:hypothetical protein
MEKKKPPRQVGHPAFEYREEDKPINYAGDDRILALCEGLDVVEWHPLPNAEGKATQVHIIITPGAGPLDEFKFLVRLKSKAACDAFIETLQRHRDSVFGVS